MSGIAIGRTELVGMNTKNKQTGFTLLEALIGFLILSIGMLGIASLHTLSLQSGKRSIYRTVAMMKAEQILESIRANPSELKPADGSASSYIVGFDDLGTECVNNFCSPADMAKDDVFRWKNELKTGLPNTNDTKASVDVLDAVAPSKLHTVTVTVQWKERSDDDISAGVVQTYTTTTDICSDQPC